VTLRLVSDVGETPFDALLRAAERDAQAAEGLALGYANLHPEERSALVETIVRDAQTAGRSPAATLALLLGVEVDRELARHITVALMDAGPGDLAERRRKDAGWAWGAEREGGVAVARHLHGEFVEVLSVTWTDAAISVHAEPLATHEAISGVRARLGVPEAAETLSLDEAIDRLAEALWRARRRGPLPETLTGLADLFEPY
jgi:hypothetical protein